MNYGSVVRQRRKELGLRQRHVAEQVGVTGDYLSMIERDLRTPSPELLEKLAEVLRVPLSYLVFQAEPINADLCAETRVIVEEAKRVAGELLRRIDELQRQEAAG